jgi:chromosome segregation ATPase
LLYYSHHHQQQQKTHENGQEEETRKPVITLRHPDMKGAVLEGLTEVSIDSMPALLESLARRRRRRNKAVSASTAVIGILKYWDSAVSYELNRAPNSQITCVELSAGNQGDRAKAESIIHRKSTVSLGQALRQLLLQASIASKNGTVAGNVSVSTPGLPAGETSSRNTGMMNSKLPAVSYRETTLTKVLQRSMESSKICLIGTISPLTKDYEQTITTLNYLRRLLVQPGKTASSPFKPTNIDTDSLPLEEGRHNMSFASSLSSKAAIQADVLVNSARKNNERLQELARSEGMLKSLVADPRQRLAKVLKKSPSRKSKDLIFDFQISYDKEDEGDFLSNSSNHDYQSTNYMQDIPVVAEEINHLQAQHEHHLSRVTEGDRISFGGTESRVDETSGVDDTLRYSHSQEERRHRVFDDGDRARFGNSNTEDEWASEEEIERALHNEINGVINELYPGDDFSRSEDGREENTFVSVEKDEALKAAVQKYTAADDDLQVAQIGGIARELEYGPVHYSGSKSSFVEVEQYSFSQLDHAFSEVIRDHMDNGRFTDHIEANEENETIEAIHVGKSDCHYFHSTSLTKNTVDMDNEQATVEKLEVIEFAPEEEDADDVTLGLASLGQDDEQHAMMTNSDALSSDRSDDGKEISFTTEEWQDDDGEVDLDLPNIEPEDDLMNHVSSSDGLPPTRGGMNALSTCDNVHGEEATECEDEDDHQTEYDLPEAPLPMNESMISQASPPVILDHHRPPSGVNLPSPQRDRSAFSSFSSPYASVLRTSQAKEIHVLSREREELNSTVESLKEKMRKATENHDEFLQQYEEEVQQLYSKLDEVMEDKRAIERLANEAVSAQSSQQEQIDILASERDELRSTIETFRKSIKAMSVSHEQQLHKYQREVEAATSSQLMLQKIADDAVAAHKAQLEETRALIGEREDLKSSIEVLQGTMRMSIEDHESNIQRYQTEIRQLHKKMEETLEEKRSIQIAADEARFALESQSEKVRALQIEKDELVSTLNALKGNVKRVSGEHDDHLRRFKGEVQQLHASLDQALSDKLSVEKKADEIRFSNDDLKRRIKIVEDELASYRANNSRLENLRREDQEIIGKLTAEIRKKESDRLDLEHMKNELLRLNRSKEHSEESFSHRKAEFTATLKEREAEISEYKNKNSFLEDELANLRGEMGLIQKQKLEALDQIKSYQEKASKITTELYSKEEEMDHLKAEISNLETLRRDDQDTIRSLKADLRNKDAETFAVDQLHHKLSRLKQDKDHLEMLVKTRKAEYEQFMNERTSEVEEYIHEVEALKKKLEAAKSSDKKYRSEAASQLRALRESESSMMQAVQKRDEVIERLRLELSTTKEEFVTVRKREKAQTATTDRELNRLRSQVDMLESNLDLIKKERDDALALSQNESRAHKVAVGELERARDEVTRQEMALDRLHEELATRQQENLQSEEKIFQMESTLRRFREETKEKVSSMIGRHKESSSVLEKTRQENRALAEDMLHMERLVDTLKRERDACFQSLEAGRRKLAQISSKSHINGLDNLFETPTTHDYYNGSIAARSKRSALPEIYITDYFVDRGIVSSRAEEIAACVAMSAKNSLQESHDEASQLRSQVYRLEEEKSAEVASLRAKIRTLERELSHHQRKEPPYNLSVSKQGRHFASRLYNDPVE